MRVDLLAKSMNMECGTQIATFVLHDFPKFLLAELNTHCLSRNAESSRARPNLSIREQAIDDPYIPSWTLNRPGMTGEVLYDPDGIKDANEIWLDMRDYALEGTRLLHEMGVHKQDINRPVEAWLRVSVLVTSTQFFWENFFELRNHEAAQPAFREYAAAMEQLYRSTPAQPLELGAWHKPWPDLDIYENTARAAGISYKNHTKDLDYAKRKQVHDDLIAARPMHGSPLEHCALAVKPGMLIGTYDYKLQIFDHFSPEKTLRLCDPNLPCISTTKFESFVQYRSLVEKGWKLDDIVVYV